MREFRDHVEEISNKAKIAPADAMVFIVLLTQKVRLVEVEEYQEFLKEARSLISDTDDIDYLALALKFNCPLWTEDKGM